MQKKLKKRAFTILSRFFALGLGFAIVIFTSRIWGTAGRGEISLFLSDLALITIFANVATGSSISYYVPKLGFKRLLWPSLLAGILISSIGATIFGFIHSFYFFKFLLTIGIASTVVTILNSYAIGKEKLSIYNLNQVIVPLCTLVFIGVIYFIVGYTSLNTYYYALLFSNLVIVLLFAYKLLHSRKLPPIAVQPQVLTKLLKYGVGIETSSFLQFINYRFSFYIIALYLSIDRLGVFSVSVALSESIWVLSRSLSVVQYSEVLNETDIQKSIQSTIKYSKLTFLLTSLALLIVAFIPQYLFMSIFGEDFSEVKQWLLYLYPGIISIAVSNLMGHYFSALGNIKVLRNKALVGFFITIPLSFFLIPAYGLAGACIVINLAHIASSLYLFYFFWLDVKANRNVII